MACVLVPIVEAVLVKTAELVLLQKEKREESKGFGKEASAYSPKERMLSFQNEEDSIGLPKGDSIVFRKEEDFSVRGTLAEGGISLRKKLHLLSNFLFSGSILLVFEHFWHGEIVPFFPFLTGAKTAEDTIAMLQEMSTVGVSMALLLTGMWAVYCLVLEGQRKREVENHASLA